jgi:hypothetical protein
MQQYLHIHISMYICKLYLYIPCELVGHHSPRPAGQRARKTMNS